MDSIRTFDHRGRIVLSQTVRSMMGLTDIVIMRIRPDGLLLIPYMLGSRSEPSHSIRRFDARDRIVVPVGIRKLARLTRSVELVPVPEGVLLRPYPGGNV